MRKPIVICCLLLLLLGNASLAGLTPAATAFLPSPPWPGDVSPEWIEAHQSFTLRVPQEIAAAQEARTLAAFDPLTEPHPRIAQMIDQVTTAQIYSMTGELSGEWPATVGGTPYTIATRHTYSGVPIQKATQYVHEHFTAAGLVAEYHQWNATTNPNVVGTLPGLSRPDDIVLLTAHVDSVPSGSLAPGADDNASGTVGVLLAAEILAQYEWDCTLRFVAFTGEEQGLLGSAAYATDAYNNGDNILGVLNLDMIAYDSDAFPIVDLHVRSGNAADRAIADLFADVVALYDLDLTPHIIQPGTDRSDHASFWNKGYPAILAIEDWDDFTPYYHTVNDRLSTLNLAYYTEFVKAAVGTFAHMGCLAEDLGTLEGTVTDAGTGLPLTATVTATDGTTLFSTTTGASGTYSLTLPVGTYTVTGETAYYGYAPALVAGVEILTDTVTPLDLALAPYPRHVVSGTVRDVISGVPLTAMLFTLECPDGTCGEHTYAATTSLGATGAYSLSLLTGDYVLAVRAPGYRPLTHAVTVNSSQTQNFTLSPRACLLLVDDDGGTEAQAPYRADLDALEIDYAVWNVATAGSPSTAQLETHYHTLWLTGDRYQQTLTASDRTALGAYLDGGGNLLLSSWGVGSELAGTPFLADYLRATHHGDIGSGTLPLTGQGPLTSHPLTLTAAATAQVSRLTPVGNAASLYDLPAPYTQAAAVSYIGEEYRVAYLGFGLENVSEESSRREVLAALLDWLGPCPASEPSLWRRIYLPLVTR